MTLTYFMARSAEVAYPRSQVSVYRTIGPLVLIFVVETVNPAHNTLLIAHTVNIRIEVII